MPLPSLNNISYGLALRVLKEKRALGVLLSLAFILLFSFASLSMAGISVEHEGGLDDAYLLNYIYPDVLVVTIKRVDSGAKNTNEDPPRLTLEIEEVLKGGVKGTSVDSLWLPYPHDVDWVGEGSREAIRDWALTPNPPPATGSRWILSGTIRENNIFHVGPRGRYPYTKEQLKWVRCVLSGW